ncbi:MAG TPA: class I SAM-dependent methyltransferase [Terriglobales bacterium]|jgi:SAM-dependent methyltransferase
MDSEREHWDRRYRDGSHANAEPDPLLVRAYQDYISSLLAPGRAVDIAGGVGRHAIWLAQRGWQVDLVDVSEAGLAIARERAQTASVQMSAIQHDLTCGLPQDQRYNVVLNFFYLQRDLYAPIHDALAPGGVLVVKTYTERHPELSGGRGPTHPMHLLQSGELLHEFRSLDVLFYRETVKDKGIAELVARKP